jgi:hypothetical protein
MLTFHNDQKIKDKYIARLKAHYEADEIIQGKYWENGKGDAIGCTVHSSDWHKYEKELGINNIYAQLENRIFMYMEGQDGKKFPVQFLESIPVGIADDVMYKNVFCKFMYWLLTHKDYGLIKCAYGEERKEFIYLSKLLKIVIDGGDVDHDEWEEFSGLDGWECLDNSYKNAYVLNDFLDAYYNYELNEAGKLIELLKDLDKQAGAV